MNLIEELQAHQDRLDGLVEDHLNLYRLASLLNGVTVAEARHHTLFGHPIVKAWDRATAEILYLEQFPNGDKVAANTIAGVLASF